MNTRKQSCEQDSHTHVLPLLPLKNAVILPKSILPIIVGRSHSVQAIEEALKGDKQILVGTQKDVSIEQPTLNDLLSYGTRCAILQVMRLPKGSIKVLIEGVQRAQIISLEDTPDLTYACGIDVQTTGYSATTELKATWRHLTQLYQRYASINNKVPGDLCANVRLPEEMDEVADTLAMHLDLEVEDKQDLLETPHLPERILKLCNLLQQEVEILEAEERIRGHVQKQVEKNQREYYLTEQIKAIQKELGREDTLQEIQSLKEKAASLPLSADAKEKFERELNRLENMQPMSQEAVVIRTYLDWILSLPWGVGSADTVSIADAEKLLQDSHAGLIKAKERIIEFVATQKFTEQKGKSPILCLAGPPGVGKTSLAGSIAKALSREFVRISLGGVHDEAEIRGHRRTYIGAMPGRIIQALKRAKTTNPVILLDEIDKLGRDFTGDPASALLEVLDPQQNKEFVDNYLEIPYDLSRCLFVATANNLETIPYALLDRLEIIELSGYTINEKVQIAQEYLLPTLLSEHNLKKSQCIISADTIKYIIQEYTQEAGVRSLSRVLATLLRKIIKQLLLEPTTKRITVTQTKVRQWLGAPPVIHTELRKKDSIGIATGLGWTPVGGDVLEIEVTVVPGKGGMTVTGQIGEVMNESAQAALSYIRSRQQELGLKKNAINDSDIHIHIPEGATPKDGPSAGITICTALISALTQKPVKKTVAMSGEITLQGRVLAVGGLKEKILAAQQHGITNVLVPLQNKASVEEFAKEIQGVSITYVSHMDEVLPKALAN